MIASASSPSFVAFGASGGKQLDDAIEQIAGALAVDRRNGDRLAESQRRRTRRRSTRRRSAIRTCWRPRSSGGACAAESAPTSSSSGCKPVCASTTKIDDVGFLRGGLGLPPRRFGELIAVRHIGVRVDAGRVDQAESAAAPLAERVEASRVTPGVSSTIARRWPISRLNSALLPTLGRPTIGDGRRVAASAAVCWRRLHRTALRRRLRSRRDGGVEAAQARRPLVPWPASTSKRSAAK